MSESTRPKFLPKVGLEEAEWVARFHHRQNVERPMEDVIHIADTAIEEFSLMLRERLHRFKGTE